MTSHPNPIEDEVLNDATHRIPGFRLTDIDVIIREHLGLEEYEGSDLMIHGKTVTGETVTMPLKDVVTLFKCQYPTESNLLITPGSAIDRVHESFNAHIAGLRERCHELKTKGNRRVNRLGDEMNRFKSKWDIEKRDNWWLKRALNEVRGGSRQDESEVVRLRARVRELEGRLVEEGLSAEKRVLGVYA